MSNYIKNLSELNKDSIPEAGGKGANLGILIHAGLPVPAGFVITTNAYRAHLDEADLQKRIQERLEKIKNQDITAITAASVDISSWIENAPMPIRVQKEVKFAFDSLTSETIAAVAVRSSATAEDLPTASFAGQHDTFLGVYGINSALLHIKKCWVSLWTPQAITYRISMGFEHLKVELAVVVQAMIASEAAGVMFTANPVSGNSEEILISAGYGLGESVVSGLITPDTYILTKTGDIKEKVLGSKEQRIMLTETGLVTEAVLQNKRKTYCLRANELKQLTNLANLVERHYNCAMDIEWALFQGSIYLLQARPITTIDAGSEDLKILGPEDKIIFQGTKPSLGMQSILEHCPYPHTPLDFACFSNFYQGVFTQFYEMGLKPPKEQIKPVERESGCVAISYHTPSLSPSMLWKVPTQLIKNSTKNTDELWLTASTEMNLWINKITTTTRNTNNTIKLTKLMEQAMKEYGEFVYKRFSLIGTPSVIAELKLMSLIKKVMGKEKAGEIKERLMRALPFRTALQNKALMKVAEAAAFSGKNSTHFKNELNNFLQIYGDRPSIGMGRMISPPTWCEKPELIDTLIDALQSDILLHDSEESYKKQEADYELVKNIIQQGLKPGEYLKFLNYLEKIRNSVILREESVFYLEKLTGCLHRMALKLGSLLVKQRMITEAEDIFFIFMEELEPVSKKQLEIKERIEKRKKAFDKVNAAHDKGVHWMISTGSIPIFETKKDKKQGKKDNPSEIKGSAASRGIYEGSVCIVRKLSEFSKLKKGDILVSPYTAPIWTPLFKVASAIVTEIGSASSHAAIIAREYGIPAVVAIENATTLLRDGQRIRVDGTNGTITLLI